MPALPSATHQAAVAAETERFAELLLGADPTTEVPSCPGWTLSNLAVHAGSVHRWFSKLLDQRVQERPTSREVDLQLPADPADHPEWLARGASLAAATFAATDPELPMWAWGADQHARFWIRRMLFETLVHRVDAELALGRTPAVDHALAVDGIDEFLTNLPFATLFAPGVAELRGTGRTIRFTATDGGGDWTVQLRPDGFGLVETAAYPAPDASLGGTAADLLLLLYGRLELAAGRFETAGDRQLLDHWFAHSAF
ncbi:maleylpyruvate isomerase family mycothiol-dependent enzyme [Streptomyces tateyamensis]|uniref:Maleylpyruvate isomerase family mycothiol-dependent enzyme n=1 Tax=Streptomyces tateyamensis TaxID=565073 RepID=A0A2V4NRZ1_9ACTN|nr:maleylpyruvate isomerase family mycothiol-dependent enzyme [Streptomyces tateyamensis]PYC78876.1 maleylpyruvate isomerase family mycothiol-dependent enzyme [Streptomyces tateyamensis]